MLSVTDPALPAPWFVLGGYSHPVLVYKMLGGGDQHPTQDRSLSCVARMRGTVAQQVVVPQSAPRYPHAGCPVAFGSCKHVSRILSRQSRGSTELGAISLREIVAQIRKLFCGLRSSRCPVSFVVFHTLFREDVPRSLTL